MRAWVASRKPGRACCGAVALLSVGANAPALADASAFDDPYHLPATPRPPTLPELTHAEDEASLEATFGAILQNSTTPGSRAYVERLAIEVPLGLRRWFVGASYEVAQITAAGAPSVLSGNVEVHGRTLWATPTGLAFGGELGLMLPAARFDDGTPAAAAALRAASLRPWDVSYFVPDAFGIRPFVDVRAVDGAFVAQFRQGLDVLFSTSALHNWRVYATAGVYLGYWITPAVAGGIEAFEAYAIDVPSVRDGARAAVVISPNVRLALPWAQPVVSMYTSVGTPLQGASEHVWGLKLGVTVTLPKWH